MTQQTAEIEKLSEFITSLNPPTHIILLYDEPLDIETFKEETEAREYVELEALTAIVTEEPNMTEEHNPLFVRNVDEQLSDLDALLREERRIDERGQQNSVICTYDLEKFMEIGEDPRMEILSLHDHILFTEFTTGRKTLIEATETAINNALGSHGADILLRYIEQGSMDREIAPLSFQGYLDAMSKLLGGGAEPLTRLIYRRLFQTMRPSRESGKNERE